ncbi:GPI-GlcNAc transferase complex, PIG-H component-domain-containing protein [Cokeromyces recurvatus]|uniref:GPI-GlcNAc transferase complex, PIG-H component-domain-containing protein n=1 Tax=Cokeromyces recurvatus TaxID=90255 RepID=UPI0022208C51|nr:GPI-GlcNAc transferase complex, PIG-H component-domain-containing protein [Cokeromyces recurvatus]KAI7905588.1 GPI-GlcNAc transferase complex, PIG-H component-domain-containing protein [Cokeromyces recurvatus]
MSNKRLNDKNQTYTIGLLTCYISPGAREYVIKTPSKLFNAFDLLTWIIISFLINSFLYKHAVMVFLIWLFLKKKTVRKESILAIRDVGIQVKTTYWGGSSVSRFINRQKVEDVIINEGISFWQIKSYMAILVKGENKMIVVFENLLPRLDPVLIHVYQGVRTILFS